MSLKLCGLRRLEVDVEDAEVEGVSRVVLVYRRPTASEWIGYNAQASALYGQIPAPSEGGPTMPDQGVLAGLLEATLTLGAAVFVDVEGVDSDGGRSAREVVLTEGVELLMHLGRHVAQSGGLKLSPGKSEAPSS